MWNPDFSDLKWDLLMSADMQDKLFYSWKASTWHDLQPFNNALEYEHTTPIYLFPPKSSLSIWTHVKLVSAGGPMRRTYVYCTKKQDRLSSCVQGTEMIWPELKSKISVGQHVRHAAMQLVEATCRPDVTQQSPSTPKGPQPLALWTFPLARIHPHCLDKLTIGCPCNVCACVCVLLNVGFLL